MKHWIVNIAIARKNGARGVSSDPSERFVNYNRPLILKQNLFHFFVVFFIKKNIGFSMKFVYAAIVSRE